MEAPAKTSVFRRHPRLKRELIIAAAALAVGALVMPFLIYAAGSLTLGAYADGGGPGALLSDFYSGLLRGSPVMWSVVLGPYLFLSFVRAVWLISRRVGAS